MIPHPEGGYFSESYRGDDNSFSSIYFLLKTNEVSHFHKLEEDELWYYHDGESLRIYEITANGKLIITSLGKNIDKGETPQYLVKKGSIFGSIMKNDGFSLVGCMVSPGFTYEHFYLYKRSELLSVYPQYEKEIIELTYEE